MLTKSAINAAFDLSRELAEKGIRLGVVQQTPLAELVHASLKGVKFYNEAGNDAIPDITTALSESANEPDAMGHNEHDAIMDGAVEAMVAALNYTNATARQVVNPMIDRVQMAVSAAAAAADKDAKMPLEIITENFPLFWGSVYVQELFSRYSETSPAVVEYDGPKVPFDNALLLTGVPGFDEELSSYLQGLGTQLAKGWGATFGAGHFSTSEAFVGPEALDTALIVYLAASKLADNPPEGTDYSLANWSTLMQSLKAAAGRTVFRRLAARERMIASKILVLDSGINQTDGSVFVKVLAPIYADFLNNGGSPEALAGAYYSDKNFNISHLIQNAATYEKRFEVYQSATASENASRKTTAILRAMEIAVAAEIANQADEVDGRVIDKASQQSRLRKLISEVRSSQLEDLWCLSRCLICETMFAHTNVQLVLEAIDDQKRLKPDMPIDEAALYACIDVLGRWLDSLITVDFERI